MKGILWGNVPAQLKWTIVALALMSLLAFVLPSKAALTERHPIRITSNSEFTAANGVVCGSGTQDDPYIIEGWQFTEVYYDCDYGIWLENTDAYVVIRNCLVFFAGALTGIRLEHVANVAIENVTVLSAYNQGLYAYDSRDIVVYNSEFSSYGSYECSAVELYSTNETTLISCRIGPSRYRGVYTSQTNDVLFKGCDVSSSDYGFYIESSENALISLCSVHGSFSDGLYFTGSLHCAVSNCTIYGNSHGVEVDSSDYITVEYCNIRDNEVGVWTYPGFHCEVHHNNFVNNTATNAQDDLCGNEQDWNSWDENYWDNYKGTDANNDGYGDTPYQLPGDAGSKDNQPLMRPVYIVPEMPSSVWLLVALAAASLAVLVKRKTEK